MMYYDRRLEDHVCDLLAAGEPLHWLIDFVKSNENHRLDFRRADGGRHYGTLQLYVGRTSLLEVIGTRDPDKFKLAANARYRKCSPGLFLDPEKRNVVVSRARLGNMENDLRDHIQQVTNPKTSAHKNVLKSFTKGEAVSHMGMMRRYGLLHSVGSRLIAVDSEIEIGFRKDKNGPYKNGTEHKNKDKLDLKRAIPSLKRNHKKLDTLAVLPDGDVALVEVKDEGGNILCALQQAAVHMHRFQALMRTPDFNLHTIVEGIIDQKVRVGLLPPHAIGVLSETPALIPVVAQPDKPDRGWVDNWLTPEAKLFIANTPLLKNLRFWCLSPKGDVLDVSP
jgi:hypothetical protein